MKKYKLSNILMPIIAFVGVFVLLINIFIMLGSILESIGTVDKYNQNITTYNENISRLAVVQQTELQNKTADLDAAIPIGGDITNLVNNINRLAASYNLNRRDVIQQTATTTEGQADAVSVEQVQSGDLDNIPDSILINGLVYPINISLSVEGDKTSILNYIGDITKQKRIMNIVSTTLSNNNRDFSDRWTANLVIYSYSILEKKLAVRQESRITDPKDPKLVNKPKSIFTILQ